MPPAGPFLSGQKGAKEPVKAGDSDFPRLNNPPLETAKKGELRFPLLGTSPRLFSWWSSDGGGLLRNAPAAPACMGGNRKTVLGHRSGLVPRPQMVPPCRGRTLAGLSLPYLPFSTLVGAAFMAARGRPQGSPLPLANNQAPASAPFGADAGANLTSIRTPRCPRCGGGAARHGCWRFRSGT